MYIIWLYIPSGYNTAPYLQISIYARTPPYAHAVRVRWHPPVTFPDLLVYSLLWVLLHMSVLFHVYIQSLCVCTIYPHVRSVPYVRTGRYDVHTKPMPKAGSVFGMCICAFQDLVLEHTLRHGMVYISIVNLEINIYYVLKSLRFLWILANRTIMLKLFFSVITGKSRLINW